MSKIKLAGKSLALVIVIAVIAVASFASTLALIIVKTNELVNTFQAGEINITVTADSTVTNSSEVPVYVRVAVVANYQDAAGNIYEAAVAGTDYTVNQGSWVQDSTNTMIYYWEDKIDVGEAVDLPTVTVNTATKNGHSIHIDFVATGVQGNIHDSYTEAWSGN